MATGTGNLPNQNMDFVPLAELPASDLDKLVENIESLADCSGIGDGAIDTIAVADGAITNAKLSTTAGDIGGEWLAFTPTISVAGGTAPTYSEISCYYTRIGKTIIASYKLTNTSGGTAGSGMVVMYISLPVNMKTGTTRVGFGAVYNGNTLINNKIIYDFFPVAEYSSQKFYMSGQSYNITGNDQNNANRYIQATIIYQGE